MRPADSGICDIEERRDENVSRRYGTTSFCSFLYGFRANRMGNLHLEKSPGWLAVAARARMWWGYSSMEMNMEGSGSEGPIQVPRFLDMYTWYKQET